jgi:hypothetical protein
VFDADVEGVLDGVDALEGPAGHAEVGHSFNDWTFEATAEFIDEALLHVFIIDFELVEFVFTAE